MHPLGLDGLYKSEETISAMGVRLPMSLGSCCYLARFGCSFNHITIYRLSSLPPVCAGPRGSVSGRSTLNRAHNEKQHMGDRSRTFACWHRCD